MLYDFNNNLVSENAFYSLKSYFQNLYNNKREERKFLIILLEV
jgi:hypothetical protein